MIVLASLLNAGIAIALLFIAAGVASLLERRRDRLEALRYRRARYRRTGMGPHS